MQFNHSQPSRAKLPAEDTTAFTKMKYKAGIIWFLDVEEAVMISILDEQHPTLPKDPVNPTMCKLG